MLRAGNSVFIRWHSQLLEFLGSDSELTIILIVLLHVRQISLINLPIARVFDYLLEHPFIHYPRRLERLPDRWNRLSSARRLAQTGRRPCASEVFRAHGQSIPITRGITDLRNAGPTTAHEWGTNSAHPSRTSTGPAGWDTSTW